MGCHCLLQSGPRVAIFLDTESRMVVARFGLPSCLSGLKKKKKISQFRRIKRCGFNPGVRKIPWSRKGEATPVFLPGESHGRRSLAGYSAQGCKESDTTEHTHTPQECLLGAEF